MKSDHTQFTLKQLLADYVALDCLPEIPVTGLSLDSREIKPGNVFVALAGHKEHGLAYAEGAVARGAVAVLCDRKFDQYCQQILSALMTQVVCIPITNLKGRLGEIASRFYGDASSRLFAVGVTGTDGKTSVSHFIAQALNESTASSAVLGTIGNGLIDQLQPSTHTTQDVIQVHRLLADLEQQGARQVAMEVSSHGLDQGRVDGVQFNVAVLTNLGRDHLDYHGDIDEYRRAKRRLFKHPGLDALVLNFDDEFGRQLATELQTPSVIWSYAVNTQDLQAEHHVQASDVRVHVDGISMHVMTPAGEADVNIPLLGVFNVSNVLATLAVLLIRGIAFNEAVKRLQALKTVPGRMQTLKTVNSPLLVIDYAHTPQALASVLSSLREHCSGDLVCVFGCGGDRDKGKRPLMAQAAEQGADRIIVTDDNPRTEDSQSIVEDICAGFANTEKVELIRDRQQAIAFSIGQANSDDIVLIAGKGHENYQVVGYDKLPFSDYEVALALIGGNE